MDVTLTVTEAVRNFADVVHRACHLREAATLLKNRKPVARVVSATRAMKTGKEIAADMTANRPRLGAEEAEAFETDLREARAGMPPWRGVAALAATLALVATFTVGSAATGSGADPVGSSPPMSSPSPAPAGISPVPVVRRPTALDLLTSAPQVEIEAKFIEISKSGALALEKSTPPSSPVASVVHQFSAWCMAPSSSAPGGIFRSSPVLPDDFDPLMRQLNQIKGVDLLSAPRVTTKSGQKAAIEIVREMTYPIAFERVRDSAGNLRATPTKFDKTNTGVTLEVNPTLSSGRDVLDLSILWKIRNFDGFVGDDGKPVSAEEAGAGVKYPVFTTQSVDTVASLYSGATVLFSMDGRHTYIRKGLPPSPGGEERGAVSEETEDERLLLITVTARLIEAPPGTSVTGQTDKPSSLPADSPAVAASPKPAATSAPLPQGIPVPGKPGFTISPYAPQSGYVDVRGFPRGQTVRDPFTGKLFLVP